MEAEASLKKARAEAEAHRIKGKAEADVAKEIVAVIGPENHTMLEIAKTAAENQLPIVPGAKASIFVDSQGGTRPSVNDLSALQFTAYMDVLKNQARLSELPEAQLPALPQSYLVCPNCQTKNSLSNNFCTKCGNRLH